MSEISHKRGLYSLLISQSERILIFKELDAYLNFETTKKELFDGLSNIMLNCYELASNQIALEEYKQYKIDCKKANLLNCEFAQWIDLIGQQLLEDVDNVQELDEMMVYFKDCFLKQ